MIIDIKLVAFLNHSLHILQKNSSWVKKVCSTYWSLFFIGSFVMCCHRIDLIIYVSLFKILNKCNDEIGSITVCTVITSLCSKFEAVALIIYTYYNAFGCVYTQLTVNPWNDRYQITIERISYEILPLSELNITLAVFHWSIINFR